MNKALAVVALLVIAPCALAGDVEVAVYVGPVLPTYEQSFSYDLGPNPFRIPGVTLEQKSQLTLDGQNGLAFSGGLTWYFVASTLGIEGRIDTADVDVRTIGAR